MLKIKIIHAPNEENPFLVIDKPQGLPSAPLKENDDSALIQAANLFPQINNVSGKKKIEKGLLHRIDTETRGILLIASTQKAYDEIKKCQSEGKFVKRYKALVDFYDFENYWNNADFDDDKKIAASEILKGFPVLPRNILNQKKAFQFQSREENEEHYEVSSFFRYFGSKRKSVRPVTKEAGRAAFKKREAKLYTTNIFVSKSKGVAFCEIREGFKHQARCHLAWLGFPVKGDKLYNPLAVLNEKDPLRFEAVKIEFIHPLTKKTVSFEL